MSKVPVLAGTIACWGWLAGCATPGRPPPEVPSAVPAGAPAPVKADPAQPSRDETYRSLVTKIVAEYRALGFTIDEGKLEVRVADDARTATDLMTASRVLTLPGQFEGLFTLSQMMGAASVTSPDEYRIAAFRGLAGSIQAYYDSPSRALVFRDAALARLVGIEHPVAHELGHAYQDQQQGGLTALLEAHRSSLDALRTAHIVLEGQAELLSSAILLAREGVGVDRLDPGSGDAMLARLASGEALLALYTAGVRFAHARYRSGGWASVAESFRNPPSSSEQVLHTEKFGADQPQAVALPDTNVEPGMRVVFENTIGEFLLYTQLLEGGTPLDAAYLAAVGWDGDRIRVLGFADGSVAAVFRLFWDRGEDAKQFATIAQSWDKGRSRVAVNVRDRVVDVAYAENEKRLAALVKRLKGSAGQARANDADARSSEHVEAERLREVALRPRLEGDRWAFPAVGMTLAVPKGFRLLNLRNIQLLAGNVKEGFAENVTVSLEQDLFDGNLERYIASTRRQLAATEQKLLSARTMTVAGVKLAEFDLEIASQGKSTVIARVWSIPRSGKWVNVTFALLKSDWPARQPLVMALRDSLRFETRP
jgi:hypothetical protein